MKAVQKTAERLATMRRSEDEHLIVILNLPESSNG